MQRRTVLLSGLAAAGLAAGGVVLASRDDDPRDGLSLALDEDFDSLDGVDLTGRGEAGSTWFTDAPFTWGRGRPSDLSVSDGVLTIDPSRSRHNYAIATMSPTTGQGRAFSHGYFEARLAFDPGDAAGSDGFPAFWALGQHQFQHVDQERSMEVDFFEAMHPTGKAGVHPEDTFAGTVHDMLLAPQEVDRANYGDNTTTLAGTSWDDFHDYGCAWTPGHLRWYFDDRLVLEQRYSSDQVPDPNTAGLDKGTFSLLDTPENHLVVILGTGAGYPLRVDRVKVWQ